MWPGDEVLFFDERLYKLFGPQAAFIASSLGAGSADFKDLGTFLHDDVSVPLMATPITQEPDRANDCPFGMAPSDTACCVDVILIMFVSWQ